MFRGFKVGLFLWGKLKTSVERDNEMNKYTKSDKLLKMNLQYFADPDPTDPPADPNGGNDEDPKDPDVELPSSQSELDSVVNKAVQKALENTRKEHEKELEKEREKARSDAENYAKMTEKEKEEAKLKERIEKLEAKERELNNKELLTNIKADLQEKELPIDFADMLLTLQDNDKIKESIENIKEQWDEQITEAIKASARQENPKDSTRKYNGSSNNGTSKKQLFDEGRKI